MTNSSIGIIGAGNMGLALASGLVAAGVARERLAVSDPNPDKRQAVTELGIRALADTDALAQADLLVLAVKPQHLHDLCCALAPAMTGRHPVIVSVVAGARTADIARWIGGEPAIVRAMPNTPALIKAGTSVLFATKHVTQVGREAAEAVLKAVSEVFWVTDEDLMDAVTALSGSGPAYLFLFLQALTEAGIAAGLSRALATALAMNTTLGAALMAKTSPEEVAVLRARVTSPGGTTEQAIKSLMNDGFMEMFTHAINAATARSQQLGKELGAL
ncbi:MAG TPA: pyrroline-5-carboxylate reductase [Acidiferrobacter sp.]|nr:pyrroline-5-carboxylate reductase [Acidiferrobacter sp.]